MFGDDWNIVNNNGFSNRDVYPTAVGSTIAQDATGGSPGRRPAMVPGGMSADAEKAAVIGGQGNIVIGGIVFFVLVFGLMFLATKVGSSDDFKSLKPSVYNVLTISMAAVAGIPIFKYAFAKFPVPGVSAWVHSI